jgi:hypothetical protein
MATNFVQDAVNATANRATGGGGWDWMKALEIGLPIAGAVTEGIIQNRAAGRAGEQLQAAGTEARNIMRDAYAPYMNLGSQAANTLGGLMGFAPISSATSGPMTAGSDTPTVAPMDLPPVGSKAWTHLPATLREMSQMPQAAPSPSVEAQAQTQSSFNPGSGGGTTVKMQAPDGSIADVPAHSVPFLESRGARRV